MPSRRVERIEFAGRPAWRKHYGAAEHRLRLAVLGRVVRWLDLVPLRPPRPLAGAAACASELAMIERLAALGARVPEVLARSADTLVLGDLGPTLAWQCRRAGDEDARARLLQSGLDAIADLHRRGGNLSQAFARNIVVQDGAAGFIDLESDPAAIMPLAAAQARDLLFYVHSTARFLPPARYASLLAGQLAQMPPEVRAEVRRVARRLRWLAPLARLAGRRARALAAALDTLTRI